jgi:hypothetical protein
MVSVIELWLPILLAAVVVFVASSIIHMALRWHASDFKKFPAEDSVLDALRPFNLGPGDYVGPMPASMAEMNSPEFKAKSERGPRVMVTVLGAPTSMGRNLAFWFVYLIVVGIFAAYVAGLAFGPGAPYMSVFRVVATVAFAGYALALWQAWIWYSRSAGYVVRATIDGLIYALLTAGVFGWLWP